MREVIAVVLCLILFLIALQTGLLRTGLDYEAVVKQAENLQSANDRLAEEIKRLLGSSGPQGVSMTTTVLGSEFIAGPRVAFEKTLAALRTVLTPKLQSEQVEWSSDHEQARLLLSDRFLLAPNSLKISAPGQAALLAVAAAVKGNNEIMLEIVGHAAPGKQAAQTLSGHAALRDASWSKAKAVANFLMTSGGLDPVQLSVTGFGAFRPLVANDTEDHRSRNRRVEIILSPADPITVIQARQWVRIDAKPIKKTAPKSEDSDQEESIGEEQLQDNDQDNFDAGYEHPGPR